MTSVALHEIVFDEAIYPRATWSQSTVDRYADALQTGEMFPPIVLESGTNRLLDGMHRTEAFRIVGRDLVPVDYHEIPDGIPAKLYAASLSSRHGDPLVADDKRQVAREIAAANPDYSVVLIAKFLGASRQTVSRYVGDIVERRRDVRKAKAQLLKRSGMSMQQIADELSVGKATAVDDVNADISDRLTEAVLREAAAELPIAADELVAEILAERTRPTPTPGPTGAAHSPPADPGTTPAPAAGESPVLAAPREPGQAPEPADVPSTAPAGSGEAVVPAREGAGVTAAPDLTERVLAVLPIGEDDAVTVSELADKLPDGCWSYAEIRKVLDALEDAGKAAYAQGPHALVWWATGQDLTAEILRVLAGAEVGESGMTMAEIGRELPGVVFHTDLRSALEGLAAAGEVYVVGTTENGAKLWALPAGGGQYKTDPAARIADVAAAAPEFVRPVERDQVVTEGRRRAQAIVASVRDDVVAIISAADLGEPGLVTAELVDALRAEVDRLASRLAVAA